MKKTFFPLAALALTLASCDTSSKDSYQTIPYYEYNLIVDTQDPSAPAVASGCTYDVKFNISKSCADVKATDIILNNQKYSFETDTMAMRPKYFTVDGTQTYNITFSKAGQTAVGSAASDLNGRLVFCFIPQTSDVLNPAFNIGISERLDLSYTLNGRYRVQTFWPQAYYQGQTVATAVGQSYSSKGSGYATVIDFEKNKAAVYVYNAEFSDDKEKAMPKVMCFSDIPVILNHEGFTLQADAPKTQVLGIKDNRTALVDSVGFQATDFTLDLTSSDLTDIAVSYKLADYNVNFRGCSILK